MNMTPENRLDVAVEVLIDDHWHPGTLEHRRQRGEVWEGFVRWSTGPGETRIGWYPREQVRTVVP